MIDGLSHEERTRRVAAALSRHTPQPGEAYPCPYLPERSARNVAVVTDPLPPGLYHSLMDLNFRRMGPIFLRPECQACTQCRAIRLPVDEFRPNRSQRRSLARNADLKVHVGHAHPDDERHALYQKYLERRHDGQMDGSASEFRDFLYTSTVNTLEVTYRRDDRLVGVGIVDAEPLALSAVYCYFDPDEEKRGLGVFNVLTLIEECRRRRVPHLYLGFYVAESPRMNYKARFRPHQILDTQGRWVTSE